MNELPRTIEKGTFGEIFLQLRLLQYGVQSAPPIKDTGNDLIAVRRNSFRAIQVKTTATGFPIEIDLNDLPDLYHILAFVLFVDLEYNDGDQYFSVPLEHARIFMLEHDQVTKGYWNENDLLPFEMNLDTVNGLFPLE